MNNLKAPCKNCEVREVGCHIKCPKYLEYAQECEHIKDAKRKDKLYKATASAISFSHNCKILTDASHKRRD